MDLGVGNARRYIDVSALSVQLGSMLSRSLPAFHALTGCNFNPALYKRGKKRPFDILKKSEIFQKALADVGSDSDRCDIQTIFPTLQSFICHMYGLKKLADVNEARFDIFNKTYKVHARHIEAVLVGRTQLRRLQFTPMPVRAIPTLPQNSVHRQFVEECLQIRHH